jgi:hypothetical protein
MFSSKPGSFSRRPGSFFAKVRKFSGMFDVFAFKHFMIDPNVS